MYNLEDIKEIVGRTRRFYESSRKGQALIQIKDIRSIKRPYIKPLNKWDFPSDLYSYLDCCIDRLVHYWDQRKDIKDDLIPALHPWFGIAEHSAFVGGEVTFTEDTSYHQPLISGWEDLEKIEIDENNQWLGMVVNGLAYLQDRSKGRYFVKLRGSHGPMDLANALRGNQLFLDFYEYPDMVHRLMDFCVRADKWYIEKQREVVGQVEGGVITGFDVWLPGNSIGQLSEDASTMCSSQFYRAFGLPYTERLLSVYQHAFVHTHSLGKHNIPNIASIQKVDVIEISSDPNACRAIEIYKELSEHLEDKIVVVELTYPEIIDNLEFLKDKKTIIWYVAEDIDDAERVVKFVRRELPVM